MSLRRLLEEFTPSQAPRSPPAGQASQDALLDIEALKKSAFEGGYASGWEDARRADEEAHVHIDAEFERCLQDLAFTYHEAVGQVRAEVVPFIQALLDKFIPEILPEVLRESVREEILNGIEDHLSPSIELQAAVGTSGLFETLLSDRSDLSISVREEPSLGPNQAFVKIEQREILVNFEPLLETVRSQLAAMNEPHTKELNHG